MIDAQLQAILWTLGFDLALFLLMISCFFCIRKKRGDVLFNVSGRTFRTEISAHFESIDLKPSMSHDSIVSSGMNDGEAKYVEVQDEIARLLRPKENENRFTVQRETTTPVV